MEISGRRWLVLGVMCVGYFLVLLDVTVVNVALPSIDAALGAGVTGLQWVVNGYAVALAALLLVAGTAGGVIGHHVTVLTGLAVFGTGSLAVPADGVPADRPAPGRPRGGRRRAPPLPAAARARPVRWPGHRGAVRPRCPCDETVHPDPGLSRG
ncbi:MAG: hypothetical protein ACXVXE_13190 [Nocardioidaceae bacterium]